MADDRDLEETTQVDCGVLLFCFVRTADERRVCWTAWTQHDGDRAESQWKTELRVLADFDAVWKLRNDVRKSEGTHLDEKVGWCLAVGHVLDANGGDGRHHHCWVAAAIPTG